MDIYKRLKTEFEGIKLTIKEYTDDGYICNYLDKLNNAIKTSDQELMIYCLENIDEWYKNNIDNILSNYYVSNPESHTRAKDLIHELCEEIKKADPPKSTNQIELYRNSGEKKIFLSHCSKDKKYGDALRQFLVSLGIKNDQLVYTSHPANKIPVGVNIYDYLRDNITSNMFAIILMSNDYLQSAACLNEMGGAWVVKSDYLCFYTPDFDSSNPNYSKCAIDTRKMGAVLKPDTNCRTSMVEFKNIICNLFELDVDEKTWMSILEDFIESIK